MTDEMFRRAGGVAMDALFSRVGDLVTSLWDHSLGLVVNILLLQRNAEDLTQEMQKLQEIRDDLSNQVERARQPQTEVMNQLSGWMKRVARLHSEVTKFQDSFESRSICITGLCLGYDAAELLRRVKRLMEEGNALPRGELVSQRGPDAVEQIPFGMSSSSMVGAQETLRRIQVLIMNDEIGVIGIYGMGGVGKTTLLTIINNEFLQEEGRGKFEVAIYVTVSKDVNFLGIQKAIGERLGLPPNPSADTLFTELSEKRFILLLDDVWENLDLVRIGIPLPKNVKFKCKILFTTRFEQVCIGMDADQRVPVGLLDDERSWELFQSKVGRAAALNDSGIQQLAKQVVAKCGGLPISLITVGRAMANATTLPDWRNAIRALDHNAVEVTGMPEVLASLKFSFDMLNSERFYNKGMQLQSCLLYCALFPEDYSMPKGEIIDYWISEGFLDPEGYWENDIEETRDKGHDRIRRLQNACLLEHGTPDDGSTVKLHDTVRHMALWITRQEDDGSTVKLHDTVRDMWITRQKFVVLAGTSSARVPQIETWESATRISFMRNFGVKEPPSWQLRCPALTTLVLRDSTLGGLVVQGFLRHMPALRVLDLSDTGLKEFPLDITTLVELRYLNLSNTRFNTLPAELGNLTNLRQLLLERVPSLQKIPKAAISRLSRLQVLHTVGSADVFGHEDSDFLEVSDLERLSSLCDLCLEIKSYRSLLKILSSDMLSRCVRSLGVIYAEKHDDPSPAFSFNKMTELRCLSLSLRQPLFPRLRELVINGCHRLTDLTWVGHLPCLEHIRVENCDGITELLLDGGRVPDVVRTTFSSLKEMNLLYLPSLRGISSHVLPFPCLEFLSIESCPNLKRLPLGPQSANKIRMICGEQEWWDGLEWDTSVGSHFLEAYTRALKEKIRVALYVNRAARSFIGKFC